MELTGTEWPLISTLFGTFPSPFTFLSGKRPILGPIRIAAIREMVPPQRWTIPDPAKSK